MHASRYGSHLDLSGYIRVLLGGVVNLDTTKQPVTVADGARFDLDSSIVPTGFQTSYFGNDHWQVWNKCCAPFWCIITSQG